MSIIKTKLKSLLEKGAVLLDVRTLQEYTGRHPEGAVNVPYEEIDGRIQQIQSWKRVIITFSSYGRRSAKAVSKLRRRGIEAIDGGSREDIQKALGDDDLPVNLYR